MIEGALGRTLAETDGADMVEWTPDGFSSPVSIIRYHDTGLVFTPWDWQDVQPQTAEDIAETKWSDPNGRVAIIMDGWPVMLTD